MPRAPKRPFPNARYGPMSVRRLLRARLLPGERLVGWAPVLRDPTVFELVTSAGLLIIPGVGQILMMLVLGRLRSLMILTDSRLLLVSMGPYGPDPAGRGVRADVPFHRLGIRPTARKRRVKLLMPGRPRFEEFVIEDASRRSHQRLLEGLMVLAAEDTSNAGSGSGASADRRHPLHTPDRRF